MNYFSPRKLYFLGFLLTACLLGISYYLQNYDGFIPCALCLLQRFALGAIGIIFVIGSIFNFKKIGQLVISTSASLFSSIGIFFSARQVWLQHLPLDKNADCGASLQYLIHVLPFDQVIARILQGSAECAQKGWEFLSLSLAEWSLFFFIGFLIFCLYQTMRVFK